MINPSDIEKMSTEEGKKIFDPNMLGEFENGKEEGEDDL